MTEQQSATHLINCVFTIGTGQWHEQLVRSDSWPNRGAAVDLEKVQCYSFPRIGETPFQSGVFSLTIQLPMDSVFESPRIKWVDFLHSFECLYTRMKLYNLSLPSEYWQQGIRLCEYSRRWLETALDDLQSASINQFILTRSWSGRMSFDKSYRNA
jgi:hypothetical protein